MGSSVVHITPRETPLTLAVDPFRCLRVLRAGLVVAFSAFLMAHSLLGQTAKKPSAKPQPYSAMQELQARIDAQHSAAGSGDPEAVETASRQVLALALQQMATLRSMQHAWPQAAELYRQSLALEDSPGTRFGLAMAALYAGQTSQALAEVDKLLASDSESPRDLALKGRILMANQDYRGAADAFSRSLEIKRDVNVQFARAVALLNLKEKEKAAGIFKEMLEAYGDRAIWHLIFGGAY